jgi:4-amino-4-deoxy-L-arabinose transferase-like glycosyltransferase
MLFGKSSAAGQQDFRIPPLIAAVLLALAIVPYFVGLGSSSLWDSNEAFYAETPREMIEADNYVSPTFNYQPRFNKPPLSYWVVATFYRSFGVSEAVERLPIAIGALIMIVAAFFLGRTIYSTEAGFYAALILATTPRFLMFARRIIIDVYLSMFMGLILLMFVLAQAKPNRRRLYLFLMYVFAGLAVLTKGPVGALLPGAAIVTYLAANRRLAQIREMMLPLGALVVVAIVVPWYVAVYLEHGWSYISSFLLKDNISRYTQPVWGPSRGPLFYIPVLMGDLFPWSLFLLPVIWSFARRLLNRFTRRNRSRDSIDFAGPVSSDLHRLMILWVVVIVIFFSLSRSKEDLYILPVYPAVAALIGFSLTRLRTANWSLQVIPAALIGVLVASVGVMLILLVTRGSLPYQIDGTLLIGYVVLVGGLSSIVGAILRSIRLVTLGLVAALVTVNWIFVIRVLPSFERYKPVPRICEIISERTGPNSSIGYFRFASPSMVFYLKRRIFEYYQFSDLQATFSSGQEVYCLLTEEDFQSIRNELSAPIYILAREPVFRVKLRGVFDRVDTPQVVLISNRPGANISE